MKIHKIISCCLVSLAIFFLGACSDGNAPVNPKSDNNTPLSFGVPMDGRNIIAVYDAVIDPEARTFTITPETRAGMYHNPLTQSYPNVLQIVGYGWTPTFWADIKLTHPFPGSGIDGFDPRVIAIIPANPGVSFYYPYLNVRGNNWALRAHNGYTFLFDNLGDSIPGNVNPFMCYFRDEPNRVWSSTGKTSETRRWNINLAGFGGPITYKLVVDVSTNFPAPPQPFVDNAKEPLIVDWYIGSDLTPTGGSAEVLVWLLDWQGWNNIGAEMECPELFDGRRELYYNGNPEPNVYTFDAQIFNEKLAPEGTYPLIFAVWDKNTNIYNYWEAFVYVTEPSDVHVRPVKFNETLPDDVWFDICVQGGGPVYVVADHPATGNVGGTVVGNGKRTALRFDNNLTNMVVMNEGTGMANPHPGWTQFTGEWNRMDVSQGGNLVTNLGYCAVCSWTVSGTTALSPNAGYIWCGATGGFSLTPDVTAFNSAAFGNCYFGYGERSDNCPSWDPQEDWTYIFADSNPSVNVGYNISTTTLYDIIANEVKSVQGLDSTNNCLVFVTGPTVGKLAVVGDIHDFAEDMQEIETHGSPGTGIGQFSNGLDMAIDGAGYILTLENLAPGEFRFQKFEPNFDLVYGTIWRAPGEPMRMDFDKSSNMLYVLCDIGIYICEVD